MSMKDFPLAVGQPQAAGAATPQAVEAVQAEIEREIAQNKILVYGKGTKTQPMCGFTVETMEFFEQFGHPYEVVNALENPLKREVLSRMTEWPTLPKVFINGVFYGDTDILGPMHEKGELKPLLDEAFK